MTSKNKAAKKKKKKKNCFSTKERNVKQELTFPACGVTYNTRCEINHRKNRLY